MQTVFEEIVPAKQPWSRVIAANDVLKITDLEGQQAVDFLCYDANDLSDRYSTMVAARLITACDMELIPRRRVTQILSALSRSMALVKMPSSPM